MERDMGAYLLIWPVDLHWTGHVQHAGFGRIDVTPFKYARADLESPKS